MKDAIAVLREEISKRETEVASLKQALSIIGGTDVPVSGLDSSQTRLSDVPTGLKRVSYTKSDESQIRELFNKGFSDDEIAERMNRTSGSISGKRHRLGLIKRAKRYKPVKMPDTDRVNQRYDSSEVSQIRDLFNKGFSDVQIAKQMGRTPKSISEKRRRLRLVGDRAIVDGLLPDAVVKPREPRVKEHIPWQTVGRESQRWSRSEIDKLFELFDMGLTDEKIADRLGRSVKSVVHRRHLHGLKKRGRGKVVVTTAKTGRRIADRENVNKRWTSQDDKMLLGMRMNGYTFGQIAIRLRRSAGSCRQRYNVIEQ